MIIITTNTFFLNIYLPNLLAKLNTVIQKMTNLGNGEPVNEAKACFH